MEQCGEHQDTATAPSQLHKVQQPLRGLICLGFSVYVFSTPLFLPQH